MAIGAAANNHSKMLTKIVSTKILEMIMSNLVTSIWFAATLFAGQSASAKAPPQPDRSDPYGGYAHNSQEGIRAFWDYQTRRGND